MKNKGKTRIIVLAAGKGTRMESDLPKVLVPLAGKPMIKYMLEAILQSGIDNRPVVVIGYEKERVRKTLGNDYDYVVQKKQLGTGHAVKSAKNYLKGKAKNIMTFYGDHTFLSAKTIKKIYKKHIESDKKITMATAVLSDFKDWRENFKYCSRIIRDKKGKIIKDVQVRDATEEEKKVTEVNPGYYCFNASWLWENLEKIKNNNAQKEYLLTDLIKMAMENGTGIESIKIGGKESLAANSKGELAILEKLAPKA